MVERKKRVDARYDLILKVSFGSVAQFHSDYLGNLSSGGLRLFTDHPLKVGEHLDLNISFPGMLAPINVEAEVRWLHAADDDAGPSAGVAFTGLDAQARATIDQIIAAAREPSPLAAPIAIVFLEKNPVLREAYAREVHNWAELEGQPRFELVHVDDLAACVAALDQKTVALAIVDVDDVTFAPRALYDEVRKRAARLPLVILGSDDDPAAYGLSIREDSMYLKKPLAFGRLMRTMKVLTQP